MDPRTAISHAVNTVNQTIGPDLSTRQLHWRPGEPLLQRCLPGQNRLKPGETWEPLLAFHHVCDSHHTDTGSGRAVEMVRQLDPGDGEFGRIYRLWAPFTGATLISAVKALNAVHQSPFSGRQIDLVVLGGDFVNNSQLNELSSFTSILSGEMAKPFKRTFTLHGTRFTYEPDAAKQRGLLGRFLDNSRTGSDGSTQPASMPLYKATATPMLGAESLNYPALFVLGNHDLEAMGHFPHTWRSSLWAIQPIKVMACKPIQVPDIQGLSQRLHDKDPHVRSAAWSEIRSHLWHMRGNLCLAWSATDFGRRAVTIDKAWELLSPLIKDLPIERGGITYYTCRPCAGVVFVMLDSVSHDGGPEGHITHQQFEWLESELSRAENNQELAIVVSHHPSYSLVEKREDQLSDGPVHLARDLVRLLLRSKAVIAHLAAHTHRNRIIAHGNPHTPGRGYWEINTCSLIDWPQQFRFLELSRGKNGTVCLSMCMVNHIAPPDPGRIELPEKLEAVPEEAAIRLASFARKLSYRDYLLGFDGPIGRRASGHPEDRNVELIVADPYA